LSASAQGIAIERIGRGKAELSRFFDVADRIYAKDPNFVAPIRSDLAKVFEGENPFFRHGEMQLFVAHQGGMDVGRIAAILDRNHNAFHGEKAAFFGFFETSDDPAVAAKLLEAAAVWGRERKMTVLRGPTNPTLNDEAGLLVDGFDSPPVLMMTYNPRSYAALIEGQGFRKAKDLLAYWFPLEEKPLERLSRVAERFRKREPDIVVRNVSKGGLTRDLAKIREVYNGAWEKNWGFVPMTDAEIEHLAKQLKPIVVPDLVCFAERASTVIGFAVALPDLNQALRHNPSGRLFPGILRVLWQARKVSRLRIPLLGALPEHRGTGVDALMYHWIWTKAIARGYRWGEAGWILEDNRLMNNAIVRLGFRRYKTYRVYDKAL
jgi:GNAT superfamily N-acetyltransferase